MYRKKVFELSNTSLLKSILCNKVFILLIALLIGFLLILFLSVRSIPNELIEMSKKMIQFENQLNSLQKKLKRYRDSQSNKTPSIDDPFSDFYDLNLYHYQNPYFYHTEEDTRFIKYERYEDRPKISKTIVSDNEILYHLDFESFYLDTPNFLDQESYDMFCDERDKPPMAPGDCEKFVSSMTTPYFTTGNETFVKNFSFDKLPECLETTTMNSFQKPTSQNVKHFEKLALITPARSNYFQHWIDHALSPLMQARPLYKR
ncbi:hypothetical protein M0811_07921 [Anaeramoeba ignava]|uniref:Uncharacterized protein n=1 Tax=Anaeramoeba ignava TaxID=1746090 RepID=A0A9Q0RCS6_ANAIG|nr:hypothetical protein M0811_07921 [Anaeramoeba ignava]